MKREGSLGEVCAVSLSPLFTADPLSHLHTSPPLSITLGCPFWSLGLDEEHPSAQPKSDDMGSPGHPTKPAGLQDLREMIGWKPSRQTGGAMEHMLPETLERGSRGRRSGIWSPAEPLSQCKEASVNQLIFIEPESREHKVERTRTT